MEMTYTTKSAKKRAIDYGSFSERMLALRRKRDIYNLCGLVSYFFAYSFLFSAVLRSLLILFFNVNTSFHIMLGSMDLVLFTLLFGLSNEFKRLLVYYNTIIARVFRDFLAELYGDVDGVEELYTIWMNFRNKEMCWKRLFNS